MNLVFNRCEPQVFAVINKDVSFYTLESHAKYSDCEIIHPNLFLTTVHNMDARVSTISGLSIIKFVLCFFSSLAI